jgi:hypothetical protein
MAYLKAVSGNRPRRSKDARQPRLVDRGGLGPLRYHFGADGIGQHLREFDGGFNPIKAPFKAFDQGNGISQKNQNRSDIGSLLGPTIGGLGDVMTAGTIPSHA